MAQPVEMRRAYRVVNVEAAAAAEREAIEAARLEPDRRERRPAVTRDRPVWVPRARGLAGASRDKEAARDLAAEVVALVRLAGADPREAIEAVDRALARARAKASR